MQENMACEPVTEGVQAQPGVCGREPSELPEKSQIVKKVLVGIPLKGHTPPRSYHDRMLMWKQIGSQEAEDFYLKKSPRYVFSLGAIGEILIPYARERLGDSALEIGADYLFMVDDDMLTPPDLFYQLVKHDKDIVAALAFTRNPDHKPVIYQTMIGFDPVSNKSYGFTKFVSNYPRNQLVQCDAVGFGAVLIKTSVLRKIPKPWFFGMDQTGEDVCFCSKAKKAGCEVWMDTSIKLGHLGGPTVITEEYSDNWNKLTPEEREKTYGKYSKYMTDNLA
jgi:hypothetical protein